jgi:hypothetical protein
MNCWKIFFFKEIAYKKIELSILININDYTPLFLPLFRDFLENISKNNSG